MKTMLFFASTIIGCAQPYILGVQYTNVDPSPTCTIRSILVSNYANGKLWQCQSGTYVNIAGGGGGGGGTVTSVGFSTNLGTVSGSPVTGAGTLTNTVSASQVVNLFTGCSGTQYLGADGACHTSTTNYWTLTGSDIFNNNGGNVGIGAAPTALGLSTGQLDVQGAFRVRRDRDNLSGHGAVYLSNAATDPYLGWGQNANSWTFGDTVQSWLRVRTDIFNSMQGLAVLPAAGAWCWPASADASNTPALCFAQNATGVVEVNNGTLNTYRDLKVRDITVNSQAGGGTQCAQLDNTGKISGTAEGCGDVTAAATLTSNLPVFGAGTKTVAVGTRSGNTTEVATVTGSLTSGNCIKSDASGNLVDAGSTCGGGGGGATVAPPYISYSGTTYCGLPLQSCTPPVAANFAWANQPTGATETANGSALILHTIPHSGIAWAARSQTISPSTTLDTMFTVSVNDINFAACGVGFLESATNKLVVFMVFGANSAGTANLLQTAAYSSFTSFNTFITADSSQAFMPRNNVRVRLKYDGTNIFFYTSNDGVSWPEFSQESKTAHFTTAPDKWFYGCDSENTSTTNQAGDAYIELLHWLAF